MKGEKRLAEGKAQMSYKEEKQHSGRPGGEGAYDIVFWNYWKFIDTFVHFGGMYWIRAIFLYL